VEYTGATDWGQHFQLAQDRIGQANHPDNYALFFLALLVSIFLAQAFLRMKGRKSSKKKRFWSLPKKNSKPPLGRLSDFHTNKADLADPKHQLDAVAKVGFEKVRLLNKEESRLLPLLETTVKQANNGHRVMAQTSLGEVLRPKPGSSSSADLKAAHASINSKRLDFAIVDRSGFLSCAIEYQGSGHYQGNAFMRDAVKKEALRRAGVPFVEVPCNYRRDDIEQIIDRILRPRQNASQHGHTAVNV